jgi:hypothetical protein
LKYYLPQFNSLCFQYERVSFNESCFTLVSEQEPYAYMSFDIKLVLKSDDFVEYIINKDCKNLCCFLKLYYNYVCFLDLTRFNNFVKILKHIKKQTPKEFYSHICDYEGTYERSSFFKLLGRLTNYVDELELTKDIFENILNKPMNKKYYSNPGVLQIQMYLQSLDGKLRNVSSSKDYIAQKKQINTAFYDNYLLPEIVSIIESYYISFDGE